MKLAEIEKKIETIEEKFYVEEKMEQKTFNKFILKFKEERKGILVELEKVEQKISNLSDYVNISLNVAFKTP